jgi:1-acyl-sn-glycerol-3-phosphate acyltransferase
MNHARPDTNGRPAPPGSPPAASAPGRMSGAYYPFWCAFRLFYRFYWRWQIRHAERVPVRGPVVLASNHQSFLDPPLIGATLPRQINYLARDTLFDVPFVGHLLRLWRVVPVDRDGGGGAGLKGIFDRLRSGGAILLFPEGTRTRDGNLQRARSGLGLIVAKSAAPVVPIRIFGAYEAYGRHRTVPRPYRVTVVFGEPLDFARERAEAQDCSKERLKQIYREISDEIMAAIARITPDAERSA